MKCDLFWPFHFDWSSRLRTDDRKAAAMLRYRKKLNSILNSQRINHQIRGSVSPFPKSTIIIHNLYISSSLPSFSLEREPPRNQYPQYSWNDDDCHATKQETSQKARRSSSHGIEPYNSSVHSYLDIPQITNNYSRDLLYVSSPPRYDDGCGGCLG